MIPAEISIARAPARRTAILQTTTALIGALFLCAPLAGPATADPSDAPPIARPGEGGDLPRVSTEATIPIGLIAATRARRAAARGIWTDNGDGRAHLYPGHEPVYATSLGIEVSADGGAWQSMTRWEDSGITSDVWLTPSLGAGTHDLSWRWVVDGTAQEAEAVQSVAVTSAALPTTTSFSVANPQDGTTYISGTVNEHTGDAALEHGSFVDGSMWVIATTAAKVTGTSPAETSVTVSGNTGQTNGAQVDPTLSGQAFHEPAVENYDGTAAYTEGDAISPGSVYMKHAQADDSDNTRRQTGLYAAITVLSKRPPAGAFRPAPHANATKHIYVEAQRDLSRVPRLPSTGSFSSAGNIADFRERTMTGVAPPMGSGTIGAEVLYPRFAASNYHREVRDDLGMACWYVLASDTDDETLTAGPDGIQRTERELMANALMQRMIDHYGAHEDGDATGSGKPYHWVAPMALAGTIFDAPRLRNAQIGGISRADYMKGVDGTGALYDWDTDLDAASGSYDPASPTATLARRDISRAGTDWRAGDILVWQPLVDGRTIDYPSTGDHVANLEALGFTNNGNDTWAVPPRRDLLGRSVGYERGDGFPDGDWYLVEFTPDDSRADDGVTPEVQLIPSVVQWRWVVANAVYDPMPTPYDAGLPDQTAYLDGAANLFGGAPDIGSPVVSGAGQTGTTLDVGGLTTEPSVGTWIVVNTIGTFRINAVSGYDSGAGTATLTLHAAMPSSPDDGETIETAAPVEDHPYYDANGDLRPEYTQSQASWYVYGWLSVAAEGGKIVGTDAAPQQSFNSNFTVPGEKAWGYYAQHGPQVPLFSPILKALPTDAYYDTDAHGRDLYHRFAREWMQSPVDLPLALGFALSASYKYGESAIAGGRGAGGTLFTTGQWGWVDDVWFDAAEVAPRLTATVPDAPNAGDLTVEGLLDGNASSIRVTMDDYPHDGWSPITDLEVSVDGGAWASLGIRRPGEVATIAAADGTRSVRVRAVNPQGAGAASPTFSVSVPAASSALFADEFDLKAGESLGVSLPDHTPDTDVLGGGWAYAGAGGGAAIGSGALSINTDGEAEATSFQESAVIETNAADVTITASAPGNPDFMFVVARYVDADNYVLVTYYFTGSYAIQERVGGTLTALTTTTDSPLTGAFDIVVTTSGSTVTADFGGGAVSLEATVTHTAATKHGLGARGAAWSGIMIDS